MEQVYSLNRISLRSTRAGLWPPNASKGGSRGGREFVGTANHRRHSVHSQMLRSIDRLKTFLKSFC